MRERIGKKRNAMFDKLDGATSRGSLADSIDNQRFTTSDRRTPCPSNLNRVRREYMNFRRMRKAGQLVSLFRFRGMPTRDLTLGRTRWHRDVEFDHEGEAGVESSFEKEKLRCPLEISSSL